MFCRNCGESLPAPGAECPRCHAQKGAGKNYCQACGASTLATATVCSRCGILLENPAPYSAGQPYAQPINPIYTTPKSRLAAGLLGIFLGGLGIHSFYLGETTKGVIQIIVTMVTCGLGSLWGFIEGILLIAGVINVDGYGNPLGN